ncbi:hypothetical protein JL101_035460 (plasmid) [Skermanella rosea]|uniref:hypothetical protein n=1 Tax=Skermanella rosea TaxID=1817965 RepID=UPI0019316756|nr:hypothetical protein [Skermanella rosea]UEM08097.1 hypothetical protein JL101_035460 [Skermanella rosea]
MTLKVLEGIAFNVIGQIRQHVKSHGEKIDAATFDEVVGGLEKAFDDVRKDCEVRRHECAVRDSAIQNMIASRSELPAEVLA